MTMDQASKDGRQALLAMASKPCMREVGRQSMPADHAQSLRFSWALHTTALRGFVTSVARGQKAAFAGRHLLRHGCMFMNLTDTSVFGEAEEIIASTQQCLHL